MEDVGPEERERVRAGLDTPPGARVLVEEQEFTAVRVAPVGGRVPAAAAVRRTRRRERETHAIIV